MYFLNIILKCVLLVTLLLNTTKAYVDLDWEATNPAFDQNVYENALNPEECANQLEYLGQINNLALRLEFLESGLRIPRSINSGNLMDWGNYHQCLGISQEVYNMEIKGKYCIINVPAGQINEIEFPSETNFNPNNLVINENMKLNLIKLKEIGNVIKMPTETKHGTGYKEQKTDVVALQNIDFTLAVCVPKSCSVEEGINGLLFNLSAAGFQYETQFCRFKNDKQWVPADYITIIILSLISLLSVVSTSYDLWHQHRLKTDPKKINSVYQSFSVYTNARRLLTFKSNPGALECVDGVRAIAMMWVILGHSFTTLPAILNYIDSVNWSLSIDSLWVTSAPISVDTFFMISGMLLVYTTAGKLSSRKLLQNIHLFYLNRLLRMFPLLAAAVMIQTSILFSIADGPMWNEVASNTNDCRNYWWSTLLYIQNFVNSSNMCLPHTWYLAIDIQLHILSPLVLYWVLSGNKNLAWIALTFTLLVVLAGSTIYNFIMKFPSSVIHTNRLDEYLYYMYKYYIATLPRASPFFVGMVFGYLLHLFRGKKVVLSMLTVVVLWVLTLILTSLVIYSSHPMKSTNWESQSLDSMINTFARPTWALALGWIIFACSHGYGGPINWLLSLSMWKLPSRLSYGMYLFHYPIMFVTAGTAVAPIFYSTISTVYRFLAELFIAMLVSFTMTLIIDSPFSTLIKIAMGGGSKGPEKRDQQIKTTDSKSNSNGYNKDMVLENTLEEYEQYKKTQL